MVKSESNVIDFIPVLVAKQMEDKLQDLNKEIIKKFMDLNPMSDNYQQLCDKIQEESMNNFLSFKDELMEKYKNFFSTESKLFEIFVKNNNVQLKE